MRKISIAIKDLLIKSLAALIGLVLGVVLANAVIETLRFLINLL